MSRMRKFLYPWTESPDRVKWRIWTAFWLVLAVIWLLAGRA